MSWSLRVPSRPVTRLLAVAVAASAAAVGASVVLTEDADARTRSRTIVQMEALTKGLAAWTQIKGGRGTAVEFEATRTARVLRMDARGGGYAGISAILGSRSAVTVSVRLNVLRHGLAPGASRPILLIGGEAGQSQQAGLIRTPRELRWATWRTTPDGRRVDVAVTKKSRVHLGVWQTVTFSTGWAARASLTLSTGSKPLTGSGPAKLNGELANRITLAVGKASKPSGKGAMLVRRATVVNGRARAAEPTPITSEPPAAPKLSHEQEPYAPTFAFNERIPAGTPSDPRSAGVVSQLAENVSASKIVMSSGGEVPPVYVAKPSDPLYSVSVGGTSTRFRVPAGVVAGGGADSPLVILDPNHPDFGRQTELRLWQASVGSGSLSASGAGLFHYNNDGVALNPDKSPSHSIAFEGYGTGSGLSILAGLIRPDEVRLGRINHALRFAYSASDFTNGYRAPAVRTDQPKGTSTRNAATAMDMGMRLQLDPAVNCATRTVPGKSETSNETRYLRMVCRALQEYGMMPMDGTADRVVLFQMEGDATADWSSIIGSEFNGSWGYIVRDQTTPGDGLSRNDTSGIPWHRMRVLARSDF